MAIKPSSPRLSWVQALSWIVGSCLVCSILAHKAIRHGVFSKRGKGGDRVEYVVQTGPYKEALDSEYLMEILEISADKPSSFSCFDCEDAEKKLLASPVIEQVFVKKIKPNMVYIDYTLRKPVAWASDFFNAALDKEGVLFPMSPFFSPKKLPEIYLGKEGKEFGDSLQGEHLFLAFSVLETLNKEGEGLFSVKRIDVSEGFSESLGKREIVATLEEEITATERGFPIVTRHFLRLSQKGFPKEIGNYLKLREHLLDAERQEITLLGGKEGKEVTVDLRLPQLAFVDGKN